MKLEGSYAQDITDVLEKWYQLSIDGCCGLCGAEECPVDDNGDACLAQDAEAYVADHLEGCPELVLERLLSGPNDPEVAK